MLEYIFFNQIPCELFKEAARLAEINAESETDYNDEYFIVTLPEETDKKVLKKLEDYYDVLIDMDRTILERELAKQSIHHRHYTPSASVYNSIMRKMCTQISIRGY